MHRQGGRPQSSFRTKPHLIRERSERALDTLVRFERPKYFSDGALGDASKAVLKVELSWVYVKGDDCVFQL